MAVNAFQKKFSETGTGVDENLIWDLFKGGDKSAYAYFYDTYAALLFRYGCKVVSDRELVKDCMHDLFTEIWKNKSNLSNPASIKNYLVKSLRNKLVREISKQARFVTEEVVLESDYGFANSNEFDIVLKETKHENEKKLIRALRTLSNKQKEVIFLLYYNNLSPAEVAAIMSVSVRTIYNTAFNAVQSLKAEMAAVIILLLLNNHSL